MYKLKSSQHVYFKQTFENGRFAVLENNFLCMINLKFAYFSVSLCMSTRKFVRFALSGNLSQEIFKTIKCTNSPIDAFEHSCSDISQQYSSDGKDIRVNFNEKRHIDFSASTCEFCYKSKNIHSETKPSQEIKFLSQKINTHIMTLALTEEKMKKVILKCQNLLSHPRITV